MPDYEDHTMIRARYRELAYRLVAYRRTLEGYNPFGNYGRIMRDEKRPIVFVLSRILMRSGLSHFLRIHKGEFDLIFHPANLAAALWRDPNHRYDTSHGYHEELFYRRWLRPGDVVVDVGANIGFTSILASKLVGESGLIVAVEPHPRTFRFLEENIALNKTINVIPLNIALGQQRGIANLSNERADDRAAIVESDGFGVSVFPLDDLQLPDGSIRLLKIDVEGYEKFVLLGAKKLLQRVELVFFESVDELFERYGYSLSDVLDVLGQYGFTVYKLSQGVPLYAISEGHSPAASENLLASRDPSLGEC